MSPSSRNCHVASAARSNPRIAPRLAEFTDPRVFGCCGPADLALTFFGHPRARRRTARARSCSTCSRLTVGSFSRGRGKAYPINKRKRGLARQGHVKTLRKLYVSSALRRLCTVTMRSRDLSCHWIPSRDRGFARSRKGDA